MDAHAASPRPVSAYAERVDIELRNHDGWRIVHWSFLAARVGKTLDKIVPPEDTAQLRADVRPRLSLAVLTMPDDGTIGDRTSQHGQIR